MKVGDLISILKKLDRKTEVIVTINKSGGKPVTDVGRVFVDSPRYGKHMFAAINIDMEVIKNDATN